MCSGTIGPAKSANNFSLALTLIISRVTFEEAMLEKQQLRTQDPQTMGPWFAKRIPKIKTHDGI